MSLLDPYSPYCIALFSAALLAVVANTWLARTLLARLRPVRASAEGLDPYEIRYLLHGPLGATHLALENLLGRGSVVAREARRTVVVAGPLEPGAHPVEAAVYHALDTLGDESRYGALLLPALAGRAAETLERAAERLASRGLRHTTAGASRQTRKGAYSLLGYAFVTAIVTVAGVEPGATPVAMLGLVGAGVVLGVALGTVRPVLTGDGAAVVKALRARAEAREAPSTAGVAQGPHAGAIDLDTPLMRIIGAPGFPGDDEDGAGAAIGPAEGTPHPEGIADFGYVLGGEPHPSSPDELAAMCRQGRSPRLVWTPESPLLVHPAEVSFLFPELRAARVRAALAPVRNAAALGALFLLTWAISGFALPSFWLVMAVAEAFSIAPAYPRWRAARRLTPAALRQPPPAVHLSAWALRARSKKALYTPWILRALLVVGAVQLVPGFHSVRAAGLVKEAVRRGQWWRLLTAPTLHGNVIHFVGNYVALLALGGIVEAYGRRVHLPVVLVLSALAGSVASQLLLPAPSVGISGGIMGCVGYLLVLGWRYRAFVPPGFFSGMVYAVASTAVVGLVGYGVIDNAAHAGGLVAGAALGLVLVPRGGPDEHGEPAQTTVAGWIWTSLFFACCALAIAMILAS